MLQDRKKLSLESKSVVGIENNRLETNGKKSEQLQSNILGK